MSEENLANALNELKKAADEMTKNNKRLVRETKKGVDLSDYNTYSWIGKTYSLKMKMVILSIWT